jgi:hypothetical protein
MVIGHRAYLLEASSGREAEVDKVGTAQPDGEAEDGAHEAHRRRPCDRECRCLRRRRKPHGNRRSVCVGWRWRAAWQLMPLLLSKTSNRPACQ